LHSLKEILSPNFYIIIIFSRSESVVPWIATELSVAAVLLVVAVFWTTLDMTAGINGDVEDMMASSSALQLNSFQDWLGVFQERYLGSNGAIVSSV
jgi:hypothetical protein